MANTDKDILITPNVGSSTDDPKIEFKGADGSTTAQVVTAKAYPTNSGTVSFEGAGGQLFSINNSTSGTIFSVNDLSGVPSIEVEDDSTVKIAEHAGNVLIGTTSDDASNKVQVNGNLRVGDSTSDDIVLGELSGYPTFGAIWMQGDTDYRMLMSSSSGATYFNTVGGGHMYFRNDNSTILEIPDTGGAALTGDFTATGNITAYFSDERLKTFEGKIEGALDKVSQLNGYYFHENEEAKDLGYKNDERQVGVSAQEVEAVLPEIIKPAPIHPKYMTVQYEKLVPLLIEAIKELKEEVRQLKEGNA
jgi:hypothetical protein